MRPVFMAAMVIGGLITILFPDFCPADATPAGWNASPACFPEDLCQRHQEIQAEAVQRRDPRICNKIEGRVYQQDFGVSTEQQRRQCRVQYAIQTGDVAYCQSLKPEPDDPGSRPWRDLCLTGLARRLRRPELCKDIYGMWEGRERDYYQALCRVQAADSVDKCQGYQAKDMMYYNTPQNLYDLCLRSVAENTNDADICDMIEHIDQKTACQRYFETAAAPE